MWTLSDHCSDSQLLSVFLLYPWTHGETTAATKAPSSHGSQSGCVKESPGGSQRSESLEEAELERGEGNQVHTASFPRELRRVPPWRCSASHLGIPHVQSDWRPSTPQPSFQRQASVLRDATTTSGQFNEGKHVQSLHVASPMLETAGGTGVGAGSSLGE